MPDTGENTEKKPKKPRPDQPEPGKDHALDLINLCILFGLVLVFFIDVVLNNRIFFAGDIMNVYTPWQDYNQEALTVGRMPLWSDDFFMGFPIFAESQGALFYLPTRLVYAFSSTSHSFSYDVLVHFFMAGCFQYFFARTLKLKPGPSLLSAIAFMFSGMLLSLPINFTIFRSIVWIPLIFALLTYGSRRRSLIFPMLAALALVMQMMGGSLQVTGITILALVPYVFFLILSPLKDKGEKADLVPLLQFILCILLAVGFYSFQLLPTLELKPFSWRGATGGWEVASAFSFPPAHLIDFILPTFYGSWASGTMLPVEPAANFFPYIGLGPLLLILPGLMSKRRGVFVMLTLLGLFFLLALGKYGYIYNAIYATVPFFDNFRAPDRFMIIVVFAGTILAGFGLQNLQVEFESEKPKISASTMTVIGTLMTLLTLFAAAVIWVPGMKGTFWSVIEGSGIVGRNLNGAASGDGGGYTVDTIKWTGELGWSMLHAFGVLTLFHFAIGIFGKKGRTDSLSLALVVLLILDLYVMSFNVPAIKVTKKEFFTSPPETARYLQADGAHGRFYNFLHVDYSRSVFGFDSLSLNDPRRVDTVWYNGGGSDNIDDYLKLREGLAPNIGMHWGLTSSTGFASLFLDRYLDLEGYSTRQLRPLEQNISYQYLFTEEDAGRFSPSQWSDRPLLVDLMASDYIVTSAVLNAPGHFEIAQEGGVNVYRNRRAFPRAWIALPQNVLAENVGSLKRLAGIEIVPDPGNRGTNQIRLVDDPIDARTSLILDPLPPNPATYETLPDVAPTAKILPIGGSVGALKRGGQIPDEQVLIDVNTPQRGYLVLADTHYPGWKAEIDGEKVDTIYRAFGYFRAIEIPAGPHHVRFYYQPQSFRVGIYLSITTLVTFIVLLIIQVFYFNKQKPQKSN